MNKPNWKYAPKWANYVALDIDGDWSWFQNEPEYSDGVWNTEGGCHETVNRLREDAMNSLEQRQ